MNASKRYKDIDMPYTCPETGRIFEHARGLSIYITKTLKISQSDYYDKYINHKDNSCFFCGVKGKFISVTKGYRNLCEKKECIKSSFNSYSIEGVMYRELCSREEATKIFNVLKKSKEKATKITTDEIRKVNPDYDKERSRNCKEFWIKKGFSLEESEIKAREVMDEIHKKTFTKFKENKDKYSYKQPTRIEYWLNKGFTQEEAIEKLTERQTTFSKDICIDKYGYEEGTKIWKERQYRWIKTLDSKSDEEKIEIKRKKLSGARYSDISQRLFWDIYNSLENVDKLRIKFAEMDKEFFLLNENKEWFAYDFVSITNKKCIEFNGDFWHCNPNLFDGDYLHRIKKIKASQVWENDSNKIEFMKRNGYEVLVIWESEYKKNPQQILDRCINFLNK